jgi:hypothetical protein
VLVDLLVVDLDRLWAKRILLQCVADVVCHAVQKTHGGDSVKAYCPDLLSVALGGEETWETGTS